MTQTVDLDDLGLIEDGDVPVDVDNLPQERSSIPFELPVPGAKLLLQLPLLTPETLKQIVKPLSTADGQRMQLVFADEFALKTQAGLPFNYTFRGRDQRRKDKEGREVVTNDIAKLLKGLGFKGVLASKQHYLMALMEYSGKWFYATNAPSPFCNPAKPAFIGGRKSEKAGCGKKYAMKAQEYDNRAGQHVVIPQIPKDPITGAFLSKFNCQCGSSLTAWPTLEGFSAGGQS